jgi:NAD(P)-dependent dehydrogenase (short-subunit alcohol dehydrogenase family)
VVADREAAQASATVDLIRRASGQEVAVAVAVDLRDRAAVRQALAAAVAAYGGIDLVVNTAAIYPVAEQGKLTDGQWATTLDVNVTANARLVEEVAGILRAQDLEAAVVLVSSANAVVPKQGSEAYDVSKAAVNHLVRELAIALAPRVRVNGVSPATVVQGSTMFPRDRVMASLRKYGIAFDEAGNLWVTFPAWNAIGYLTPRRELEIVLEDGERSVLQRPSNICFGWEERKTAFIGSLDGNEIPYFEVPYPGARLIHQKS